MLDVLQADCRWILAQLQLHGRDGQCSVHSVKGAIQRVAIISFTEVMSQQHAEVHQQMSALDAAVAAAPIPSMSSPVGHPYLVCPGMLAAAAHPGLSWTPATLV